jgi:hypothetical protein
VQRRIHPLLPLAIPILLHCVNPTSLPLIIAIPFLLPCCFCIIPLLPLLMLPDILYFLQAVVATHTSSSSSI